MWSLSLEIPVTWQVPEQLCTVQGIGLDMSVHTGYLPNPLNKESRAGNIITRSLRNCLVHPSCDQVASNTRTTFLTLYHRILTWGRGPDIIYFQICRFASVWQLRHCDNTADLVVYIHRYSVTIVNIKFPARHRTNLNEDLTKENIETSHYPHLPTCSPMTYATHKTPAWQSALCYPWGNQSMEVGQRHPTTTT